MHPIRVHSRSFAVERLLTRLALIWLSATAPAQTTTPMQICFGGGDHTSTTELEKKVAAEKPLAERLARQHGTSHETYVRWSMIEPQRGKFDFSFQDALLAIDQAAGLKWVPFIVLSPAYTLPDWFYQGKEDVGYVCLEHHKRTDIQSLWSPYIRSHVARAYAAFGKHYAHSPAIESVLIGVSGNYGETLVPASGLDWTQDLHGPYHTHPGWWTADKYANADFRSHALREYGSLRALNDEWGTTFTRRDRIATRLPHDWSTTAARQFQAEWMLNSMTDYADFCMREAKKALPNTDVYLVIGGHAPSFHGLDISAQVEAAAKRKCGVRITNEADPLSLNLPITRMVASACRLYGTFFSYEPAGAISYKGIASRTFNAVSSGARCLHWYENNVRETTQSLAIWENCQPYLTQREPVINVAVLYPRRWMNLQGNDALYNMYFDFGALRSATDYDLVDERMLRELMRRKRQPYDYLIVCNDYTRDHETRKVLSNYLKLKNAPDVIHYRSGIPAADTAGEVLVKISRTVHPQDDFYPGVYFTRFKDGGILFYNSTDQDLNLQTTHPRMVDTPTTIPAHQLAELPARH